MIVVVRLEQVYLMAVHFIESVSQRDHRAHTARFLHHCLANTTRAPWPCQRGLVRALSFVLDQRNVGRNLEPGGFGCQSTQSEAVAQSTNQFYISRLLELAFDVWAELWVFLPRK